MDALQGKEDVPCIIVTCFPHKGTCIRQCTSRVELLGIDNITSTYIYMNTYVPLQDNPDHLLRKSVNVTVAIGVILLNGLMMLMLVVWWSRRYQTKRFSR